MRRGLREVEGALGQSDAVDRGAGRRRDRQRERVGVADVLGGEDHHSPGDEARVLARPHHHREPENAASGSEPRNDLINAES